MQLFFFLIDLSDGDNTTSTFGRFRKRKKREQARPTAGGLVRVVGAVFDAVAFGVQLVDAHLVLALVGEVGAAARGCSGRRFWKRAFLKTQK